MQTSNEFEDEQISPRLDVSQTKTKLGKEKVQELVVPQPDQAVRYLQIAATGIFFVQTGWALAGNNQPGNVVRVKLGLTEYEWTSTYNQLVTCAGILGLTIGAVAATCPLKYGRKEVRGGFLAAAVLGLALSLFANIWSIIAGRLLHGFATGVHLSAGPRDLMGEFEASPANKRNQGNSAQRGIEAQIAGTGGSAQFKPERVSSPIRTPKVNYETVALPVNESAEDYGVDAPNKLSRHILQSRILQTIKRQTSAKGQRTRVMAGVTMYNEDESELQFTMEGIVRNHAQLSKDERFDFGDDELMVVCICDGYEKIPQSFKTFAAEEGLYDENVLMQNGFMRSEGGKTKMLPVREVNASMESRKAPQAANYLHLFHKRTMCKADNSAGCTPVNVIFALKQENRGKTDSLRWLMRGFTRALEADYYFMTDTGSKMLDTCLTKMVAYMEYMPKCAGVGVERYVDFRPTPDMDWATYCVLAYQVLEYKFTIMTQGSASLWGYQTTFQGNCCLLRAPALKDEICDELFYFEENPSELPTALEGNYCLVEDSKVDNALLTNWAHENHVNFIFDAAFETDCPKDISTWLKQRRRWSNGDVAAVLTNTNPRRMWNMCSHGLTRTIACIDYQFNNINRLTKWIEMPLIPLEICYALASQEMFLALLALTGLIWLAAAILPLNRGVYYIMFFTAVMSTINAYIYYGIIQDYSVLAGDWMNGIEGAQFKWAFVPMWITAAQPLLYIMVRPLMTLERAWQIAVGLVVTAPFSSVWPAQTLYQFANLHDVTWGNRPISKKAQAELSKKKDDYLTYRFNATLVIFVLSAAHFWLFVKFLDYEDMTRGSFAFLAWKSALLNLWKNVNTYLALFRYKFLTNFCFYGKLPAKIQKWTKQ